jgi:hypothetical protein
MDIKGGEFVLFACMPAVLYYMSPDFLEVILLTLVLNMSRFSSFFFCPCYFCIDNFLFPLLISANHLFTAGFDAKLRGIRIQVSNIRMLRLTRHDIETFTPLILHLISIIFASASHKTKNPFPGLILGHDLVEGGNLEHAICPHRSLVIQWGSISLKPRQIFNIIFAAASGMMTKE